MEGEEGGGRALDLGGGAGGPTPEGVVVVDVVVFSIVLTVLSDGSEMAEEKVVEPRLIEC